MNNPIQLSNGAVSLSVTQSVGPRILSLRLGDGDNLFADLPDLTLDCPGAGPYHLYGGHRLWHAPEEPPRTYLPDDEPVEITHVDGGLIARSPVEVKTGIQKTIEVRLPDDSPLVVVDHTLTNRGLWVVETAPWVLSMLRPGGVAVLPQTGGNSDPYGVLPNRSLVLWPYTDVRSSHIGWGNRFIFIQASLQSGAVKLGYPNRRGWLAYHWNDTLFVKYAAYHPEASYFDSESSSECYCGPLFIELETLGPRALLTPGASVVHREVWRLFGGVSFSQSEDRMDEIVEELGLDNNNNLHLSPGE